MSPEPKDIVTEAMRCMISQLKEDLHTLPTPLIVFFKMAQEEVEEKEVEVGRDCVGLQVCKQAHSLHRHFVTYNPISQALSQDLETGCPKLAIVKFLGVQIFNGDHNILRFQP